jgi:hypothetical protein
LEALLEKNSTVTKQPAGKMPFKGYAVLKGSK